MKKISTILGIATVAIMGVACNKISVDIQKGETMTFRATFPEDDMVTKVSLDLGTKAVNWEAGDVIRVISPNNWTFTDFTLTEGAGTKTASFTGTRDFGEATKMAAFYGTHPNFTTSGVIGSSSCYVQIVYPSTQSYANGPQYYLHFMTYSTLLTNSSNLTFRPLECIVKIPVKGSGVTLSSIRIDCDGVAVAGRYYGLTNQNGSAPDYGFGNGVTWDNAYDNASGYANYINYVTLTGINVALTDEPQFFYIVVANKNGSTNHGGLTVTLTPSEGAPVVKTFANFTSTRGKIYKFPEVDMNT